MVDCMVPTINKTSKKAIGLLLTNNHLIKNSDELKRITGRREAVKDSLFNEEGFKYQYIDGKDSAFRGWKKLSSEDKTKLEKIISNTAYQTQKSVKINNVDNITPIADAIRQAGFDKDLITTVQRLESKLNPVLGKDAYKIRQTMSPKRGIEDIYDNIISYKYAFLMEPNVEIKELDKFIKLKLIEAGVYDEKTLSRLIDDIKGGPLGSGVMFKWMGALKQLYTNMKYGPINALGGTLLFLNNMVMGNMLLLSKKRGLDNLYKHPIINELMSGYNFLKSQDRALANVSQAIDMSGKNRYFRGIDWLVDKIPLMGIKGKSIVNSILQGGVHNGADFLLENQATRTAIAQALVENGINGRNVDSYMKLLQDGRINQVKLDMLRSSSASYYHDFFSNSNNTFLNRHRFSRWHMFTTLQGYVLNRTAGIYNGLKQFSRAWKEGKIKNWGDFVDHLNTTNQELKAFVNNTLLAAKTAIYTDHAVNEHEYSQDPRAPYKYMIGMADYLSSLDATFWVRILKAPLEGIDNYLEYTAATGRKEEFIDGVSAAALNTLGQTLRLMFREGNIVGMFADAGMAYMKTGDLDFAKEVGGTSYEKISNGMGRFMLLPGVDAYGQKPIAQDDDIIGRLFMDFDRTNLSIKEVRKMQGMATIDSMLDDGPGYILRTLQYMPILKSFTEANRSTGWNEARYKYLQKVMDTDPVLQEMWKGELPRDLLLANEKITSSLYNDLLTYDYSYKKYKGEGEHDVADRDGLFGSSQSKESVFVDNIAKVVYGSREAMDDALLNKGADKKSILKVLAASEANTPGSSRIILSYLARKDFDGMKESVFGSKYYKSADIPAELENEIKTEILQKRYPYLYVADRTSQYKAVREYLNYAYPDIYQGIQNDNDLKHFVNTMAWTDMMVMLEGDKGSVDANYIKNVFNTGAKYIQNNDDRINLVNHTLATISGMTAPSNEVKQLMKIGVLSANIDFYDSLKNDPLTSVLYKEEMDRFENIVWGTIKNINLAGNALAMGDLNEGEARQYYGAYGSKYSKPQYSDSNRRAIDGLMDQANKKFDPIREREYSRPIYTSPSEIGNLSPKRFDVYVRVYNEQYKAFSEDITKSDGRKYPSDFLEGLKFSNKTGRVKTISRARSTPIKKGKRKPTSKSTKSSLPGGTNAISAS